MKKDKKYYLEKLSCGISRMKRDNNIEILRGPKTKATGTNKFTRERIHTFQVTYEEMLPGSLDGDDLFSIELFPPSKPQTQNLQHSLQIPLLAFLSDCHEKNK